MISVSSLGKWYGDQHLFSGVSFQLNAGERYGLIGANGSGKTTLLDILSGDLEPSEGSVSIPKGLRLGVLRQDQFLYEDEPILGVAMMGHAELWTAMRDKEVLLASEKDAFDADRFHVLEETIQRLPRAAPDRSRRERCRTRSSPRRAPDRCRSGGRTSARHVQCRTCALHRAKRT